MKLYTVYISIFVIFFSFSVHSQQNHLTGHMCSARQNSNAGLECSSITSHQTVSYHPKGDRDHDGIPNYRDRINDNKAQGDRDHDGVPNAKDKHNNSRDYGDKDHDGIANIRDDHDNRSDRYKNEIGAGRNW